MPKKNSHDNKTSESSPQRQRTPAQDTDSAVHSDNVGGEIQGIESLVGNDFGEGTFQHHAALLGDPRMSHPNNTTQRTALVQKLQRDYGNPYVQRLVDHIHRKREQGIQPKLEVGPAGDKYEKEADAVAKQVVSRLQSADDSSAHEQESQPVGDVYGQAVNRISRYISGDVQVNRLDDEKDDINLKSGEAPIGAEGGDVSSDVEGSINSARGGGQSLPDNVRSPMEGAFGADFSSVKVHTGSEADSLNKSMSARAFTTGSDIFFAKGEYNPGSKGGQETLAHELTHVVQQTGGTLERKEEDTVQATPAFDEAVQREFGFEVEVPIFLTYTDPSADNQNAREDAMAGSGGDAIFEPTSNFEIKVDHNLELNALAAYEEQAVPTGANRFPSGASIIELVTKPWDEQTLEAKDIKSRTKEMVDWIKEAKKRADKGQSALGKGYYLGSNSPDAKAYQTTDGYIQATYGVKLSSVGKLIDMTTKVNPKAQEHENLQSAKAVGPQVMNEISIVDAGWDAAVPASDGKQLEGFIILLANYLIAGGGASSSVGLGKNAIGEYFYKTDMGKLANSLPKTVLDRLSDQTNGSIDTLWEEILDKTGRSAGEEIIKDMGIKCGDWVWDVIWGYKDHLLNAMKNEYSAELGPDMLGPSEDDQEAAVIMENREVQYLDPKYESKKKKFEKEQKKFFGSKKKRSKAEIAKELAKMTDPKKWPPGKWNDMFTRVYLMVKDLNT